MKNNAISSSQFYFSMFLTSLISLLFIDNTASFFQIIYIILPLIVNIIIISFYNSNPGILLKSAIYLYLLVLSTLTVIKLSRYMHIVLKSGPYWALVIFIMVTAYFCTLKGLEPLARAGLIIGVVSVAFVLYISFILPFNVNMTKLSMGMSQNIHPSIALYLPSALYVLLKNKIRDNKRWHLYGYSCGVFIIDAFFIIMSAFIYKAFPVHLLSKMIKYGVFKGGDCLFLVLMTISVLYIVSFCSVSISVNTNKHSLTTNTFLALVFIFSLLTLLYFPVENHMISQMIVGIVIIIDIISIFLGIILKKMKKNA